MLLQTRLWEAEDRGKARGEAEGKAEGEQVGRRERDIEIARNLLRMSISVDDIVKATGLPLEKVNELRKELLNN